ERRRVGEASTRRESSGLAARAARATGGAAMLRTGCGRAPEDRAPRAGSRVARSTSPGTTDTHLRKAGRSRQLLSEQRIHDNAGPFGPTDRQPGGTAALIR